MSAGRGCGDSRERVSGDSRERAATGCSAPCMCHTCTRLHPPAAQRCSEHECVVCGVWCVVCGVWCVVCGVWCVVCGVECAHAFGAVLTPCALIAGAVAAWITVVAQHHHHHHHQHHTHKSPPSPLQRKHYLLSKLTLHPSHAAHSLRLSDGEIANRSRRVRAAITIARQTRSASESM